jgi:DNA-directed RNA polymerase subunit M/transcription elongation factor TFIIS
MSAQDTIKDTFHDAIANGNWEDIARVYEAITGEPAPKRVHAVVKDSLVDILSRPIGEVFNADADEDNVDVVLPSSVPGQQVHIQGGLIVPEEDVPSPPQVVDDGHEDFSIQHGTPQNGGPDADGKTFTSREPIPHYPNGRPNEFRDNGKLFKDQKVTENPDDPELGVPVGLISERGGRQATTVNVTCRVCSKQESVSPALATGHNPDPMHNTYTCNTCCAGGSKSRRG